MKTAIIIHGWPDKEEYFDSTTPSPSNNQWLPWLQKQLGMKGWGAQTPEMPDAYEPDYKKWKNVFEQFSLDEETVLIGHSCGGGFLVRYLSENQVKVGQVILVAPWIDPEKELNEGNDFFNFTIDSKLVSYTTNGISIFCSTNDHSSVLTSVKTIINSVEAITLHEVPNAGHFCIKDGYAEFPELLEEIK